MNTTLVGSLEVFLPDEVAQEKIAEVLVTIDEAIEKTEDLIAKYEQIKQGMMHDLFTRGVDQNDKLRPSYEDAPELYQETEVGIIPKDWDVMPLSQTARAVAAP